MLAIRLVRRSTASAAVLAVTLGAALTSAPSPTASPTSSRTDGAWARDAAPVSASRPTNAAKVFRWGNATWKDEFREPLSSQWLVEPAGLVRNQHGMLTLDSADSGGEVTATLAGPAKQYGRWEARVRGRSYGRGTPFRVVWELVASDGSSCGARDIVLSDYTLGRNVATMHLRNLPDVDFLKRKVLPLKGNEFHTFAVEVTPDRISWFVDTEVMMTERRSEARTGATYVPRFRLVATPGATMRRGRMQMDWARYYTLERRNARSIEAPPAQQTTYAGAC